MTFCTRENGISAKRRRDNRKDNDALAPKPVHPRSIDFHGFLGEPFVRQHLMVDERWTPSSLSEQLGGMVAMLQRRAIFKHYEIKTNRQHYSLQSKCLKLQCRVGRTKLQSIVSGNNQHHIRNYLNNHRDMKRLYQRMPIDQVVDNINQRTFVMRKERDRLQCRLGQLKQKYRELLMDRAVLENRIKYQNEFVLEEEIKSQHFIKKIENSNVRIKAIKAINTTYNKIIQVLQHDAIFYEPILRSLSDDMEDQANFIKHILYLGMPAISKFKDLNHQYRLVEMRSHQNLVQKQQLLASLQGPKKPGSSLAAARAKQRERLSETANPKRYLRETRSMMVLKNVLKGIEKVISDVKKGTLCSQAKEIYPRIKSQSEIIEKMRWVSERESMKLYSIENKMDFASVLQSVLVNNLSEEEINRLEKIKDLRKSLETENEFETAAMEYIKYRAHAFVMLRVSLWNLMDILRHVEPNPKIFSAHYPNSYLRLPLLKFEMLHMYSAPPELYEIDAEKIMHVLKRRVFKLTRAYDTKMESAIPSSKAIYHNTYLDSIFNSEYINKNEENEVVVDEVLIQDQKIFANVPTRKQIKANSHRVYEEAIRAIST